MYQLRFFMYVLPIMHFWCMVAADQVQTGAADEYASATSQTQQPVDASIANEALIVGPSQGAVSTGALPPQESSVIQNITPPNQTASAVPLVTTDAPIIQNLPPKNQDPAIPASAEIQPTPVAAAQNIAPQIDQQHMQQVIVAVPEEKPKSDVIVMPQAPQPTTPAELEEKIVEPQGIDTVDLKEPEGNWLFKRIWWEESKKTFGKIRERVDKIVESRMHFFKERVKLDREVLDPFYVEVGLDQGALQESAKTLIDLLRKNEEEYGALSVAAQERLASIQEEKAAISKLGEAVKSVRELNQKMDEALEQLMNQINLARAYERDAWQRLDRIAEELNDKRAREDYYAIVSLWRNIKEISNYIQGEFAQYFIQLAQATVQNVKNIKSIADLLEKKGFDLKKGVELTLAEEEAKAEEDDEEDWPVKRVPGWGEWLWDMITAPFSWIGNLFS